MEFKQFCEDSFDEPRTYQDYLLNEALITFGKKAYPKFGNVVIMAGGAGCFDGETLVSTKRGLVEIKEVKEDDVVLSFNEETKKEEWNIVKETIKYDAPTTDMLEIEYENGEKIICTENHEFYVDGEWVEARDL